MWEIQFLPTEVLAVTDRYGCALFVVLSLYHGFALIILKQCFALIPLIANNLKSDWASGTLAGKILVLLTAIPDSPQHPNDWQKKQYIIVFNWLGSGVDDTVSFLNWQYCHKHQRHWLFNRHGTCLLQTSQLGRNAHCEILMILVFRIPLF